MIISYTYTFDASVLTPRSHHGCTATAPPVIIHGNEAVTRDPRWLTRTIPRRWLAVSSSSDTVDSKEWWRQAESIVVSQRRPVFVKFISTQCGLTRTEWHAGDEGANRETATTAMTLSFPAAERRVFPLHLVLYSPRRILAITVIVTRFLLRYNIYNLCI